MNIDLQNHQYPIGRFLKPEVIHSDDLNRYIDEINSLPLKLRASVSGFSEEQLDSRYRDGGWTVRQVVHHMPDSHLNSYLRFKLALTEENPTIRGYFENLWAELPEASSGSIEMSLDLLAALHIRWVTMLRALSPQDMDRTFVHPETEALVTLRENTCLYAWHGNHHLAQIESLKVRKGWN